MLPAQTLFVNLSRPPQISNLVWTNQRSQLGFVEKMTKLPRRTQALGFNLGDADVYSIKLVLESPEKQSIYFSSRNPYVFFGTSPTHAAQPGLNPLLAFPPRPCAQFHTPLSNSYVRARMLQKRSLRGNRCIICLQISGRLQIFFWPS